MTRFAFLSASLIFVWGCAQHHALPSTEKTIDCASVASYAQSVRPIINERCSTCHNPTGEASEHDFDAYESLHARRRGIATRVAGGIMPPPGARPLAPEERKQLVQWAQCGAPRN